MMGWRSTPPPSWLHWKRWPLTFENLDALIEAAFLAHGKRLLDLIEDVRRICDGESDWRRARTRIDERHGYHCYSGPCPMATNHAAVLVALLLGR